MGEPLTADAGLQGAQTGDYVAAALLRDETRSHTAAMPGSQAHILSARSSEPLLTAAQLAKRFAVSQAWVYQAVADGRLPYRRLGRDDGPVRFVSSEIDAWLETQRRGWTPGGHR